MQITNISEAKAQLSALVERVRAGEDIIIGKAGLSPGSSNMKTAVSHAGPGR